MALKRAISPASTVVPAGADFPVAVEDEALEAVLVADMGMFLDAARCRMRPVVSRGKLASLPPR
ncbi:hypothetical protein SAE02_48330 [Skermanella aerolata]|uniref:Uncharacterized protein n=1 Tax=Skermanella aerolata TaxID=393310 RepID=A0A512DW33_9PROT|nr:hypothetical protein SAE02_48330 [Skermanella aerolata]